MENRLVSVTGAATAAFVYDADGKPLGRACRDQVKATVSGVTTYGACPEPRRRVGNHYEVKNGTVTNELRGRDADNELKMLYNWRRGHHGRK